MLIFTYSATVKFFSLRIVHSFLLNVLCLFLFCCCSYNKIQHLNVNVSENNNFSNITFQEPPKEHWIYRVVPRHRSIIHWYDIPHWCSWTLFGNDDDGLFGETQTKKYRPNDPETFSKALFWWCRNPLHNFCFYVIGSANRQNSEFTLIKLTPSAISFFSYSPTAKTVFASPYTSFYLGLHGGKPFFSLRLRYTDNRRGDFYGGWRERGNFGLKFLPFSKIKKPPNI